MVSRTRAIGLAALMLVLGSGRTGWGQSTHQHKDSGNYVVKRAYSHVDSIRDELLRNPNEYGGHRRKAIDHLSAALAELDKALWAEAPQIE